MRIRCLDFETTGIPTEDEPQAICEAGWVDADIDLEQSRFIVGETRSLLCHPGRPMPPEARAIHHITDEEIAANAVPMSNLFIEVANPRPDFYCAHAADFEKQFFGNGEVPWIDTWKVALRVYPEAPSHSLQVLRYWLNLVCEPSAAMPPHRAGPDAYICAVLLAHMAAAGTTIEEMARWSNGPALLTKINFGKHRGERWENLPTDYLRWIADKSDLGRDEKANAKHWLKQRGAS